MVYFIIIIIIIIITHEVTPTQVLRKMVENGILIKAGIDNRK